MRPDPKLARWARCRRYLVAAGLRLGPAMDAAARDGFAPDGSVWIVALGQVLRQQDRLRPDL